MDDGERNGSDSDDGSSASWVILNDDDHISEGEDSLATAGGEPSAPAPAPAPAPAGADSEPPGSPMDSSGESAKTVVERTDVSAGAETSGAAPPSTARVEEGSDIEVIPAEHTDDVYFEDDPMDLTVDVSEDSSSETVRVMGALPAETVLRQRRGRGAAQNSVEDRGVDRDQTKDQTRDQGEGQCEDQKEGPETGPLPHRQTVQPVPADSDRDRWADDTDLSTLTDQMVLDEADAGRLRQYVHQRNNTVNHLLTVVLVLCVTCVLGLGVGHFLGWLHHHEMTEEIVHTLDEKLDVLRDDLMTCMTTEDDQDLDNKWIKELLTENEALLQQLHGEEEQSGAEGGSHCSEAGYARLRDQVNQLRMENDELKANIAKMRYGTSSQDGYVLRRHRDKINQLVTENGELARELRRTRYLQPPAGITDQEDDPAPSAGQPTITESERAIDSDSDSAGDSPEFLAPAAYQADSIDSADSAYSNDDSEASFTTFSDSDPDSADSDYGSAGSASDSMDDDSSADEGLLAALLSWRPAPGSVPLQEARHRLWSLWQEASDFSRAEPASKYVQMAGKTLAKVEKTLLKAMHKVQQFGEDMMQDDDVGGGRMEKVAGKLGRKVDKVVAKLDARWQEIRRNWEGKVAAREAEQRPEPNQEAAGEPERPAGPPPNASDPSVAAYYARRSRHRQHARGEDAADNWQMERGKSRAEMRGAFHGASWLLERAQARQQLRQRRGEEAPVPPVDQRWRQERAGRRGEEAPRTDGGWRHEQQQRHEWSAADDDDDRDDDDDDDDDDYEDHAARLARHMAASARFHDRIQKTVHRHAVKIDRKVRENHWKHFGGRNRHEFRERGQKY
ncbi:uncharacterized protein LOC122369023 [Amphibalanus amphitrite]|uniref:uncharacterized protein LOC122369023 n=1 Tax=Amphibalanus amphitrite TaxID=1232801 RepID=UPI001C90403B|nr:uncharacterized protein LOC122369023 [Amphibalanus amphitrite]XP_043199317.1 uncharacterized protein LOC122369023 [Amphibalanus amphitrite]XP_043199318.1 uncharacterized protein LOC122369023 [Amphibalanus amphitrite]